MKSTDIQAEYNEVYSRNIEFHYKPSGVHSKYTPNSLKFTPTPLRFTANTMKSTQNPLEFIKKQS